MRLANRKCFSSNCSDRLRWHAHSMVPAWSCAKHAQFLEIAVSRSRVSSIVKSSSIKVSDIMEILAIRLDSGRGDVQSIAVPLEAFTIAPERTTATRTAAGPWAAIGCPTVLLSANKTVARGETKRSVVALLRAGDLVVDRSADNGAAEVFGVRCVLDNVLHLDEDGQSRCPAVAASTNFRPLCRSGWLSVCTGDLELHDCCFVHVRSEQRRAWVESVRHTTTRHDQIRP